MDIVRAIAAATVYIVLAIVFVIAAIVIYSTKLTGYHTPSFWWAAFSVVCAAVIVLVLKYILFFIGRLILSVMI